MSPPIYTPDGSEVSEIVLPDGSTASQVIGPDGNVVFEAGPDIADSGVLRYEFEDDADTTTAVDSWESASITAYDGAINGASYSTDSNKGSLSLLLDGTDDTVDINSRSAFPIDFASDGLTIVAYIKFNSIPGGPMAIAEHNGQSTGWAFLTDNGTDLKLFHRSNDSIVTASLSGISTGTWHFCVGQYDPTNNDYRLRIDGSSTTLSDNTALDNPSGDNRIGRDANNNWSYLDARLSEYRIYNKFLSSSELDDIQ